MYQLLGGAVRDRIRMYGWVGGENYGEYIASAQASVQNGFTVLKTAIEGPVPTIDAFRYVEAAARRFAELRAAVGPTVDIGIDFHGRVGPPWPSGWRRHWNLSPDVY